MNFSIISRTLSRSRGLKITIRENRFQWFRAKAALYPFHYPCLRRPLVEPAVANSLDIWSGYKLELNCLP
jgi:hypothetical protein